MKRSSRTTAKGTIWSITIITSLLLGCSGDEEPALETSSILPPLVRFTQAEGVSQKQSGLESIGLIDYNPFDITKEIVLDDDFSDLEPWQDLGQDNRPSESFLPVTSPEFTGGCAVKIVPGLPIKSRMVKHGSNRPLTVCIRLKLPLGTDLEAYPDLLGVGEIKRRTRLGLKAVTMDQFMRVHNAWRPAVRKGDWIDCYETFTPKGSARYLVVGINGSSLEIDSSGEVLVDRIMIRSATVAEAAEALMESIRQEGDFGSRPMIRWQAGDDFRDALVMAVPGRLELTVAPGEERIFRCGITLPLALCPGHSRRIILSVRLREGGEKEKILHKEKIILKDPQKSHRKWLERSIALPLLEEPAALVLSAETGDTGRAVVAWGAPCLAASPGPDAPPNVVLVSIDTLRADRLGAYGGYHPEGVSPFMDRIAKESILFENPIAQAPFTLPSHVSMLSGQYPSVHRVYNRDFRIDPDRTPMLASALARAGYMTGAFTGGLFVQHTFGFDEGFDTFFEKEPLRHDHMNRVLDWVRANERLPFFLFFHTYSVHGCAFDDPEYIERFDRNCTSTIHKFSSAPEWVEWLKNKDTHTPADQRCLDNRYAAGIRMADDALRSLVGCMEELGLMDNTILVITSDHGKELLDRGNIQHGHTLYEELIRVPLIIRPPGGSPPKRVPDLVEVLDIPPTLLDWLGLPVPDHLQGQSLACFLGPDRGRFKKPFAFAEVDSSSNKYALRTRDRKIIYNPLWNSVGPEGQKEFEFFDLNADPEEKQDLTKESSEFEDYKKRLASLRDSLENLADSLKKPEKGGESIDPELMDELRAQGYVK